MQVLLGYTHRGGVSITWPSAGETTTSMTTGAGRRVPFRALDTNPSLGKGARGICASGPMPLLSSASSWKYPLSPHLSVGHGLPGHFRDHAQCRSCGLSSASVSSVGVVPWHRSLRLCCANPTARAISDMAVGPNPDSNSGLSDRKRQANDIRGRTRSRRGIEPGLRESGSRNFFPTNSSRDRTQVAPIEDFRLFKNSQTNPRWFEPDTCRIKRQRFNH